MTRSIQNTHEYNATSECGIIDEAYHRRLEHSQDHMQSWDIGELIPLKMPGMEINLAVMSVAVES